MPAPDAAASLPTGAPEQAARELRDGLVMIDDGQHIVAIDAAAESLLGCRADEVLGAPLARFIPPGQRDDHAAWVQAWADAVAGGAAPQMLAGARHRLVQALGADGRLRPLAVALTPVVLDGPDGPRRYGAALLRDLGTEQSLRDDLQRLRRSMQSVFEQSPAATWVVEGERIVFANRAAARLFGVRSPLQLVGRSVQELLHPDSHATLRRQVARALSGRADVAHASGQLRRAGGGERDIEIAVAALPDHSRTTVQMVVADVTRQRRETAALERSRHELRGLSASVESAREQERRRIARELHDELGQRLLALKLGIGALMPPARRPGADDQRAQVGDMLRMVDDTLASVRRIAADLRPTMLDDLGLNAAIEWLARETTQRTGIVVGTRLVPVTPPLPPHTATALYRVVQEALTNVARHAGARTVQVSTTRGTAGLQLTVDDDGVGVRTPRREGSFGLVGMRERVGLLGGRFSLRRRPEGGTRLQVTLPPSALQPDAPEAA